MTKQRVAYLGPVSSYSHQATISYFPEAQYEHVPLVAIKDIFDAVKAGEVDRGVVPFENSTNGSVVFTLDLFADRDNQYEDLSVCGEIYHHVHHCLLGHAKTPFLEETDGTATPTQTAPRPRKPIAKPVAGLRSIKKLYTHPQAFGQCELFLGSYLRGVERIDVSSTSKAAEIVKNDTSGESAAIASKLAGELNGLDVLAQNIEDRTDNTTRFFVLRKGLKEDDIDKATPQKAGDQYKSFVRFTVDHKSPGALVDVLESFKRFKVNLTSINSRPSRVRPFHYIFFVEFEGSKFYDELDVVKAVLESIDKTAHEWRWLGSWKDQLKRLE